MGKQVNNKKPRVLVTGSNGQLGHELLNVSSSFPQFEFHFFSRANLDISNADQVNDTFKKLSPDYCINCAAYTAVDLAEREEEMVFAINSGGAYNLALASKDFKTRYFHISTDYVFDGKKTSPYAEDDQKNPQTVYGASKAEGEERVMQSGVESIIIRTSWVYSKFGKNFVRTMLRLMQQKDEIGVVNDQVGSPTFAADLASVIMEIIIKVETGERAWKTGIYHYSNEGEISWFDFANEIKKLRSMSCRVYPISTEEFPTPARRPSYSVLDKTKIKNDYDVEIFDWRSSLAVCLSS